MESYYYNSSTILKYLRKVLNEIHKDYVDNGLRVAFIMKRYAEKYKIPEDVKAKLVLLCLLKDIGVFYQDGTIDKKNNALAAASSYTFLKHCSPLGDAAKPLLFYKAKYIEDVVNDDYNYGLLITLLDQIVMYVFQEYNLDEIESLLKKDRYGIYNPKQIKRVIRLLTEQEDILEKLNQKNSIFVYETSSYIQHINYSDEDLLKFIDTTNYAFEFHNHETLGHTVTTSIIARELAKLTRLTENQINCIYLAALVHDIGKIRVPIEILCNPNRLTGNDLLLMRKHVEYTKEIIEGSFSYKICEIAGNHHEKLDGSGYPRGLRAIDLSIGDKIITVADIASALYCKRSYKESMSENQIVAILRREVKDGKLEPRIVNHFIDNFDDIMLLARAEEKKVLNKYNSMQNEFNALKESKKLYSFFKYDIRDINEEPELSIEEQLDLYDLHEPVDLDALVNATFDGIYLGNEDEEDDISDYVPDPLAALEEKEESTYEVNEAQEIEETSETYEEVEESNEYEEIETEEPIEDEAVTDYEDIDSGYSYEEETETEEPIEDETVTDYEDIDPGYTYEEETEEPIEEETVTDYEDIDPGYTYEEKIEDITENEDDSLEDNSETIETTFESNNKELEDTDSVLSMLDDINTPEEDEDAEFEAFINSLQEKKDLDDEKESKEEIEEPKVEIEEEVNDSIEMDDFDTFVNSLEEKEEITSSENTIESKEETETEEFVEDEDSLEYGDEALEEVSESDMDLENMERLDGVLDSQGVDDVSQEITEEEKENYLNFLDSVIRK